MASSSASASASANANVTQGSTLEYGNPVLGKTAIESLKRVVVALEQSQIQAGNAPDPRCRKQEKAVLKLMCRMQVTAEDAEYITKAKEFFQQGQYGQRLTEPERQGVVHAMGIALMDCHPPMSQQSTPLGLALDLWSDQAYLFSVLGSAHDDNAASSVWQKLYFHERITEEEATHARTILPRIHSGLMCSHVDQPTRQTFVIKLALAIAYCQSRNYCINPGLGEAACETVRRTVSQVVQDEYIPRESKKPVFRASCKLLLNMPLTTQEKTYARAVASLWRQKVPEESASQADAVVNLLQVALASNPAANASLG